MAQDSGAGVAAAGATRCLFVRHGETGHSRQRRITGGLDVPLSPVGEGEARAAGELLAHSLADQGLRLPEGGVVYVSRLRRTQQTADLILAGWPPTWRREIVPGLEERGQGERLPVLEGTLGRSAPWRRVAMPSCCQGVRCS